MTKVDIISGFLGAGKTTFIKQLINQVYAGQKLVLIENEFGEIGIDGGFLKESGVNIKEINSGCICCSLVGDFSESMKEVINTYSPERIIIEPSGVGKLSDIINAINNLDADVKLNILVTVVDGSKAKIYLKNFGEFFINQVDAADTVMINKIDKLDDEKLLEVVSLIKEKNPRANIITTPINELDAHKLLEILEDKASLKDELIKQLEHEHECCCGHHHEHEHHHDDEHHHHQHGDEYGISTFVYYRRCAFDFPKFDAFVSGKWDKSIIRSKGVCYFAQNQDMSYLFEQAGVQKGLKEAGLWLCTAGEEELKNMMAEDPSILRDWDEEHGDKMIKIVIIGRYMDKDAIIAALDNCLAY